MHTLIEGFGFPACLSSGVKSSITASPICQEGQSERPSLFFQLFPDFLPLFPDFWQIFRCQGRVLCPLLTQLLRHWVLIGNLDFFPCEALKIRTFILRFPFRVLEILRICIFNTYALPDGFGTAINLDQESGFIGRLLLDIRKFSLLKNYPSIWSVHLLSEKKHTYLVFVQY